MNINLKTEIGPFDGSPTAGDLLEALAHLPAGAFVTLEQWDSQMDGAGWRIKAHWTETR